MKTEHISSLTKPVLFGGLLFMAVSLSAGVSPIINPDNPCCAIPHNMSIGCNELPYNFNPNNYTQLAQLFGSPAAHPGCAMNIWIEQAATVNLNSCGYGTITRHFHAPYGGSWGSSPMTCEQVITVTEVHDYWIKFPADASGYCELPNAETEQHDELACDLLAVSITDLQFQVEGDACYKILRTYRVLNWCEYDGISGPYIIGRDEDCDNLPGDEPVWLIRKPNGVVYIDRNNNPNDNNPGLGEKNVTCGHNNLAGHWRNFSVLQGSQYYPNRGYWQYTQHIKVYDNVKPVISFTAPQPFCSYSNPSVAGCPGQVQVPFSVSEECSSDIEIKLFVFAYNQPVPLTAANNQAAQLVSGSYPNYQIHGTFPLGNHTFELHVKDGCGNVQSVQIPFKVVDCKAPAPICIHGLTAPLMPLGPSWTDGGMLEIWALDLIASFQSDCTPPVKYSINRVGETPNANQASLVLTCADPDTVRLEIYGWDSANNPYAVQPNGTIGGPNYDHCNTYIILKNREEICEPPLVTASAAGLIVNALDSALAEVEVMLSGGMTDTTVTPASGAYSFASVPMGYDYELRPHRDGDDLNGISTADLLLLKKHLLGLDTLDSPYLLIAADVDSSGLVNDLDFEALRRMVLMQDTVLTHNTSWRFVDADFDFTDPLNPWSHPFPEYIVLDSLMQPAIHLDFIGIKIGDLNQSATLGEQFHQQAALEERSFGDMALITLADKQLTAGAEFSVMLPLPANHNYSACQLALEWDADLVLRKAQNLDLANGQIAGSGDHTLYANWVKPQGASDEGEWLKLTFTALTDGLLSEKLRASSQGQLASEVYDINGNSRPLALQYNDSGRPEPALFQNYPNPSNGNTQIGFYLPENAQATLTIYTLTGAQVLSRGDLYEAGYHTIIINRDELPAGSVLLYSLQTSNGYKATRRMVVLD